MTGDHTRREFLTSIGATALTPFVNSNVGELTKSSDKPVVSATELVITDAQTPPGYDQYPSPDNNPFIEALKQQNIPVDTADTANTGYWRGGEQDNPEWVLSSLALVADTQLDRAAVNAAAETVHHDFVESYDAETSPLIDFNQSQTRRGQQSDWHVDLIRTVPFNDEHAPVHMFSDLMRLQYCGNVLLGTIAFGPHETQPDITSLVTQYATLQREQYHSQKESQ
jgi:hypothetical protein